MSTKTIKNVITFGIIVAAVLIGVTFIMSSSVSAAVAVPGAGIIRPAINEPIFTSKVAPRPFFNAPRPFIAPRPFVRPNINPFFPRINPFFDADFDVNPFFFDEEGFAAD